MSFTRYHATCGFIMAVVFVCSTAIAWAADRPNILWITSEDNGQELGCYGDALAVSPNIDALAARGFRFRDAWSNAPVCAPARTTIISGRYATADGADDMRSSVPLPQGHHMFPYYLRRAGYYCTNNSKEDYNLIKPDGVWDESSGEAHYRNRRPGQPFFAVFNITISHESQARSPGHVFRRDPDQMTVPAYHPDVPEARRNWAQYYDKVTEMDEVVGEFLRELADEGLEDDTIIVYFGDHGAGLPRSKRWPYDSGLRVPLIVYFPEKYAHLAPEGYRPGGEGRRLIGFVDLAPTMLSIAGLKPPESFQGSAFAGVYPGPEPRYLFGFRGRMDERHDMVRSITDGRYVYLRHYRPDLPYAQYVSTMFRNPTMQAWERGFLEGTLSPAQRLFWEPKPVEELYDLKNDRWEVTNLAISGEHPELERMRAAERAYVRRTRDIGFIPAAERMRRAAGRSPRDVLASDERLPELEEIYEIARRASDFNDRSTAPFLEALNSENASVRYWGVLGLRIRGPDAVDAARMNLRPLLSDESPSVRIVAAESLVRFGRPEDRDPALEVLAVAADLEQSGLYASIEALNGIDSLGDKAAPLHPRIARLPREAETEIRRIRNYPGRIIAKILGESDH